MLHQDFNRREISDSLNLSVTFGLQKWAGGID